MNSGHASRSFSSVGGVGRVARLGLLLRRQPTLAVEQLAELDRRVEVERAPGDVVDLVGEALHLTGQAVVDGAQLGHVDADPHVLHPGEHPHERVLDLGVQPRHSLRRQRLLERRGEAADRERGARAARCASSSPLSPKSSCPTVEGSSVGSESPVYL